MQRFLATILALSVVLGLLGGCSAAAPAAPREAASSDQAFPPAAPAGEPAAEAPAAAPQPPGGTNGGSAGSGADQAAQLPWDRMVIRTANLSLVVKNVDEALDRIRDLARTNDGYVASSQTRQQRNQTVATVTVQVPAQNFDGLIQQVKQLAVRVQTEQTGSQDVTEEYVDLQSQLRNLQATEASLLKLMDQAERIEDILSLQRELTNVRGQIERIQGRVNYLQRRADMSTLVVSLTPEELATSDEPAWQPLRTVERAWRASLQFVQGFLDVLIAAVVFVWWTVPIVALVVWLIRRRRRNRPAPPTPTEAPAPPA